MMNVRPSSVLAPLAASFSLLLAVLGYSCALWRLSHGRNLRVLGSGLPLSSRVLSPWSQPSQRASCYGFSASTQSLLTGERAAFIQRPISLSAWGEERFSS